MSIEKGRDLGGVRDLEGLRRRCKTDDAHGCWVWMGSCCRSGAPAVNVVFDGKRSCMTGRRASLLLSGKKLKPTDRVFRAENCADHNCINPTHSVIGTHSDSCKADYKRNGWKRRIAAEKAGFARAEKMARLTLAQVGEIRESADSQRKLAERYGVCESTIRNVRRGKTWRPKAAANSSVFSWRPAA